MNFNFIEFWHLKSSSGDPNAFIHPAQILFPPRDYFGPLWEILISKKGTSNNRY